MPETAAASIEPAVRVVAGIGGVSRAVDVHATATLTDLHHAIAEVFGWRPRRDHRFLVRGRTYVEPALTLCDPALHDESVVSVQEAFEAGHGVMYAPGAGTAGVLSLELAHRLPRQPSAAEVATARWATA